VIIIIRQVVVTGIIATHETILASWSRCSSRDTHEDILSKSLTRSRDYVASDAPHTIEECYGEMTSLFTSSDDGDGVTRLVDILLGKLDGAHDKLGPDLRKSTSISSTASSSLSTQFEKLLHRQEIQQILQRIEDAIDAVRLMNVEREFSQPIRYVYVHTQ